METGGGVRVSSIIMETGGGVLVSIIWRLGVVFL